ncbi:Zinc finger CCCH domain-containing protein 10 [Cryptotermes secundus]|uniref:Zinc finger CCCH domain-containing protein 10 n=1 Tax=Cryptotermes secundus TaxID=105785 RepID=A0A2J7QG93_9NEOP|nr:zinc finger CCCH domain-containing protein 10 [Cryptotermes secundus]PNF27563.1 Zinc finger CCCH domain-containing protein 10 [Cryptotermes secundus]
MSSENGSDSPSGDRNSDFSGDRVCRDFLRKVCRRGKRCKFVHPNEKEQDAGGKFEYIFCHDYQNSKCSRPLCRFVHCTREEEEYYRATGELPRHVLESAVRKGITPDVSRPGELPVCKDHLKGECRRGGKCRFRHLSVREYEIELTYGARNPSHTTSATNGLGSIARRRERFEFEDGRFDCYISTGSTVIGLEREFGSPEIKRRQYFSPEIQQSSQLLLTREGHQAAHSHCYAAPMLSHAEAHTLLLDDENSILRKKIEELKKQVSDLTATNEFLLDQNAQLRMGGKRTANVTAVTVPAVTITNTGAPTMQVQPITAQIQPAQAPTPQQMVNAAVAAGTLRTVTASVATVPVSIAAVAGAPVSIATVSMAPVQIPPPVVTMAQQTLAVEGPQPPQQPGAPPQQGQQQNPQQGGPQSLPMSISGATAPLVSYPIMTQDLRPVLQTSLSH